MLKAVLFDEFAYCCQYFNSETAGGYGCDHPQQQETREENGEEVGCCFCWSCPLGCEAEQEDLTDPEDPDAVKDNIDWDGLCEDGEVAESEILLICADDEATEDQKKALADYELYLHRYDKKWLDEHGIINALAE